MTESRTFDEIVCEVCGVPASLRALTATWSKDQQTIRCDFCQRLIDSGMIRPDVIENGRQRYRRWNFNWTEGDLLPVPGETN